MYCWTLSQQEAVVVMKVFSLADVPSLPLIADFQDIFRRCPSTYEGVIPTLCANIEELDEPEYSWTHLQRSHSV
jgi:hypothetical protein